MYKLGHWSICIINSQNMQFETWNVSDYRRLLTTSTAVGILLYKPSEAVHQLIFIVITVKSINQ